MEKALETVKNETVLVAATILMVASAFFVPPSTAYFGYINVRTLLVLFILMWVVQFLSELGVFDWLISRTLRRISTTRGAVLVALYYI